MDFSKVIELNPKYAEAYVIRGAIYTDMNLFSLAKMDAQKACELGSCELLNLLKKEELKP